MVGVNMGLLALSLVSVVTYRPPNLKVVTVQNETTQLATVISDVVKTVM